MPEHPSPEVPDCFAMWGRRRLAAACIGAALLITTGCLDGDREVTITGAPTATPHVSAPKRVAESPPKALPASGTAAVRTPTGVVGLFLGETAEGASVRTPCGRDAVISSYEFVTPVDVVLDPGHGGLDPGASSSTRVTEAEFNFDIAQRVRDELAVKGISTLLTREGDYFLSIADRAELATVTGARAFGGG